ncbi:hypothetical protein Gferi_18895 [Geosporobacter ferrireducens]|uniref:Uncharacterized protein n=1 Tax=Geosporobacter ferrireducens TaxID=1424294 RepID=A0A1D8GKL4_9FIRM|nr:hypothetical protein Gferi_18895 [Geosporobacter ferrireducens]
MTTAILVRPLCHSTNINIKEGNYKIRKRKSWIQQFQQVYRTKEMIKKEFSTDDLKKFQNVIESI